jgi:hypothetical protein
MDIKYKLGQSLVESLVALAVSIVIVSGMLVAVNLSLKTMRINKTRSYATKLARDGMEAIRQLRDSTSWHDFYSNSTIPIAIPNGSYCLLGTNSLSAVDSINNPNCEFTPIGFNQKFRRSVDLDFGLNNPPSEVKVHIVVSWSEDGVNFTKRIDNSTTLSNWK